MYLQDKNTDSTCGITAISDTEFVVIERDGKFSGETEAHKKLYKINRSETTDVSDDDVQAENGMLVNGKTLEQLS